MVKCMVEYIKLVDKNAGLETLVRGLLRLDTSPPSAAIEIGTSTEKWQRYRNPNIPVSILKIHRKKIYED